MRRVLTVGVTYTGDAIAGVEIENLFLVIVHRWFLLVSIPVM